MARRFSRFTIHELEALFAEKYSDVVTLVELQDELSHRKSERAGRLRTQVRERLAILQPDASAQKPFPENLSPRRSSDDQSGSRPHEKYPSSQSPPASPESLSREGSWGTDREPPPPPITNQPHDILSAWTAMELISPQVYVRSEDLAGGDKRRVTPLNESLPWERGDKSRPNYRLYYQVVLGSIKMESAMRCLVDRYGDNREDSSPARGKAALAIVVVDRYGQLIESPAVGISSFGWGAMSALNGKLVDLARWIDVEPRLVERIEKLLGTTTRDDGREEGQTQPVTGLALLAAYEALVHELGLPREWVEPPDLQSAHMSISRILTHRSPSY